ncbi:hypothetical protein GOODEAATRI_004491 [Goodea atripinnis]|uniref:Uncharacterized protein n=1 Tax=Goodea atripinnis TaxID=208336 RepID=A0ABV0PLA9_9TELE
MLSHSESRRLQQDLEKVQQLEGKITEELSTLKEQVSTMESELHTYGDLETLRQTAEDKRKESDYASVAKIVSQQVEEYNKSLIESLQTNGLK